MIPPEDLSELRAKEAQAATLRQQARDLKAACGVDDLESKARALESEAEATRDAWCAAWGILYDATVAQPSLDVPKPPAGLTFSRRTRLNVTDPDALPRDVLAPVRKLLTPETPGVTVERYWTAVVSAE